MEMIFRMHENSSQAHRHHFKLVEAKLKTVAEPHVKRELSHVQARLGQAGTELQNVTAAVYGQKKLRSKFTRRQRRSRPCMPPLSGPMTTSAAGTAGVEDVHQRQRTVDDASGLSQDLSSLDEDGSVGAATDSRCTLQNKKVQRK